MPFHLNVCHLAGTITRTPEIKHTPKGTAVCQIGLAINRTWKDDSGKKHEETTFIDAEAWGKTAEIIGEYCDKGHTIFIEARIKQDSWEDKETGKKRSKIKVMVERFHFVSKPRDKEEGETRKPSTKQASKEPEDFPDEDPDEGPF